MTLLRRLPALFELTSGEFHTTFAPWLHSMHCTSRFLNAPNKPEVTALTKSGFTSSASAYTFNSLIGLHALAVALATSSRSQSGSSMALCSEVVLRTLSSLSSGRLSSVVDGTTRGVVGILRDPSTPL